MIPLLFVGSQPELARHFAAWPQRQYTDLAQALAVLTQATTPAAIFVTYDATTLPLLHHLRRSTVPHRVIVLASGHATVAQKVACLQAGGDMVLVRAGALTASQCYLIGAGLRLPPHRAIVADGEHHR